MTSTFPASSREMASGTPRRPMGRRVESDERLVARAASGDEQACAQLHDRHAPHLLSFCRYLLGSRDEAQDAVQQTFLRAFGAIRSGKAPDELRPWLYAIARNRCRTMRAARRNLEV